MSKPRYEYRAVTVFHPFTSWDHNKQGYEVHIDHKHISLALATRDGARARNKGMQEIHGPITTDPALPNWRTREIKEQYIERRQVTDWELVR
jgi:hypothetical protein